MNFKTSVLPVVTVLFFLLTPNYTVSSIIFAIEDGTEITFVLEDYYLPARPSVLDPEQKVVGWIGSGESSQAINVSIGHQFTFQLLGIRSAGNIFTYIDYKIKSGNLITRNQTELYTSSDYQFFFHDLDWQFLQDSLNASNIADEMEVTPYTMFWGLSIKSIWENDENTFTITQSISIRNETKYQEEIETIDFIHGPGESVHIYDKQTGELRYSKTHNTFQVEGEMREYREEIRNIKYKTTKENPFDSPSTPLILFFVTVIIIRRKSRNNK